MILSVFSATLVCKFRPLKLAICRPLTIPNIPIKSPWFYCSFTHPRIHRNVQLYFQYCLIRRTDFNLATLPWKNILIAKKKTNLRRTKFKKIYIIFARQIFTSAAHKRRAKETLKEHRRHRDTEKTHYFIYSNDCSATTFELALRNEVAPTNGIFLPRIGVTIKAISRVRKYTCTWLCTHIREELTPGSEWPIRIWWWGFTARLLEPQRTYIFNVWVAGIPLSPLEAPGISRSKSVSSSAGKVGDRDRSLY